MQVISCPTRAADPGTNLGLMVLCDGPEGCAAVDVSSGALVRGRYSAPAGSAPQRPALVRDRGEGDVVCRFGWAGVELELPVADQPVRRAAGPRSVLTGADLEQLLGFAPTLLVLALSDPQDGRCYKVVVGFLPRP